MPIRATVVLEQNANTIAQVQVDTNVYATAGAGSVVIRSGREAKVYIMAGTQTASLTQVVLELANAAAGDIMTVKKYTTAVLGTGASQIQIISGSGAGPVIGAIQVGTATPYFVDAYFDGVQWR